MNDRSVSYSGFLAAAGAGPAADVRTVSGLAACRAFGITLVLAPPNTPTVKPHVERNFGTTSTGVYWAEAFLRKLARRLPRDMAERQRLGREFDQALSSGQLKAAEDALGRYLDGLKAVEQPAWNELIINLTEIEYQMLRLMLTRKGKVFTVQNLYESVWNEPYLSTSANTVMVHIRKLRAKIEDDPKNPETVKTVWGKGYRIE